MGVVKHDELKNLLAGLAEVTSAGAGGLDPRVVVPPGPVYASLFGSGALPGDDAAGWPIEHL